MQPIRATFASRTLVIREEGIMLDGPVCVLSHRRSTSPGLWGTVVTEPNAMNSVLVTLL